MSNTAKKTSPKRVGPFEAVTPPDNVEAPAPKPTVDEPKSDALRKLEEERKLEELRDESGKAAETSRRSSMGTLKKAKGGYVKAADGCAQRGKTRGRMI